MARNGTSTQTSFVSSSAGDRSRTRTSVRNAMGHSIENEGDLQKCFDKLNGNENGNGNGYHESTNDGDTERETTKASGRFAGLVSFLEFVFVSIYKCIGIGLHAGLAISFLAIVTVWIMSSFHDRYFVTILSRARRTDQDLKSEITYYQRRCDVTDLTTSDSHHIHFGDVNDTASEIFIDVDKIWKEENSSDFENPPDFYYDERGFKTKYQTDETSLRRRKLFSPKWNIWETPELRPIPKNVAEIAGKQAVSAMMKHGSVMIPQMISDATISSLRDFVERKNDKILGTPDEYPMTGNHRISYGIESTEHPSVVRALKEIYNHGVFANLIQNLVGDENPALTEITAITAWEGADDQSWHADIKPSGNSIKFGRTYSHSYSLFLPLQETTKSMGATDICPGSHMCADEDLSTVCNENAISTSDVRKAKPRSEYSPDKLGEAKYKEDLRQEGSWRAGDGMLLNQMGWHRGAGYSLEEGMDRIVFIVSFIKRPNSDDPRQLARGTYFHQKWLNWGSTWEDMVDTMANLQRPWNILRCLHLYKPSDRSWGYDLFYSTALRIANGQMGGQPEDLSGIIENVIIPLNFPEWLEGDLDYDNEEAWTIYLSGTLNKTLTFLYDVNFYGHIGLIGFLAVPSILGYLFMFAFRKRRNRNGRHSMIGAQILSGAKRLLFTHGLIFALGFYVWRVKICSSQWAIDIDSGKTLMRPFPVDPIFRDEDPGVIGLHTTLPRRSDVLINTRMNTNKIGIFQTWFQYHPANRVFDQFVEAYGGIGGFYHSILPRDARNQTISTFPSGLSDKLANSAFDMITKHHGGGRFLMQDYRSGDWLVMSETESIDYIKRRLLIGSKYNNALGAIQEEIDILLDKQRFGAHRKALPMSWNSQLFLLDLSKEVFSTNFEREVRKKTKSTRLAPSVFPASSSVAFPQSAYRLSKWEPIGPTVSSAKDDEGYRRFLIGNGSPAFRPGMEIWLIKKIEDEDTDFSADAFRGTIIKTNIEKRYPDRHCRFQIALDEDGIEELESVQLDNVSRDVLRPRSPITSNGRITSDNEEGESFDGTILLVMPDGSVDAEFDNGETFSEIPHEEYLTRDAYEMKG